MIPDAVAAAWGWQDAQIAPLPGGLINATHRVSRDGVPIAVIQRLHSIFGAAVNLDIEAVTAHLEARGMVTPRLIRTLDGRAWHEHDDRVWRALSWIDGETIHAIPDPRWAEAGGELVGRFHHAVADLQHTYHFARAGVHDTAAHLARLAALVAGPDEEGNDLARAILAAASDLPAMPHVPRRHIHGDLKISNLLFGRDVRLAGPRSTAEGRCEVDPTPRGVALVDLDTLALGTLAFDLGDALRSWCNPHGEDAGAAHFELPIFAAAIRGFRGVADAIVTDDERRSIVVGLETVCVELAARFAVDVFRDDYFGWDATRFPSRRAHNLVRARGQLALGLSVRASRDEAMRLIG